MKRRSSHTQHAHHPDKHNKYKIAPSNVVGQSEYARSVLRQVACEITRHAGYTHAEPNAIETLTEVLERMIVQIASGGKQYCEAASRTQCNILDVRLALSDLKLEVRSLRTYAMECENSLYETAIPEFPLPAPKHKKKKKKRNQRLKTLPSLTQAPQPFPAHIPSYLPPFPPRHSYQYTPTYPKLERDPGDVRNQQSHEKCSIEQGLSTFAIKTKSQPLVVLKPDTNIAMLTAPIAPAYLNVLIANNGAVYETISDSNSTIPTIIEPSSNDMDTNAGLEATGVSDRGVVPGTSHASDVESIGHMSTPTVTTKNTAPDSLSVEKPVPP